MRGLKLLVIVLGVVVVLGFAAVVYGVATRLAPKTDATTAGQAAWGTVALREPEGTRLASVTAIGDRVVLHLYTLTPGTDERLLVVDTRTGAVVGRLRLGGER